LERLTVSQRVYLTRVKLFFGHAGGNAAAILFGAVLLLLVFNAAEVATIKMAIWFSVLLFFVVCILYLEYRFKQITLTINNAKRWLLARASLGLLLCAMYGLAPFLLPETVRLQDEMFMFIILSSVMTIACTSYSIMPMYYIAMNGVTMVPLTLYFSASSLMMHQVMMITAVIWQIVVLKNAWAVSKTAIGAAYLTEELQDEMTQHLETKNQLEKMARQDSLTELPNRRSLIERLTMMVAEAKRYQNNIVVMFIDIDDFKHINDNYGHAAGDLLLQAFAVRLKGLIRASDMVARFGGDEFVFASANALAEHDGLVERILAALSEPILLPSGESISTFGSIGIAQYPENGDSPDSLIKAADEAMYQVKATGKSGFYFSKTRAA